MFLFPSDSDGHYYQHNTCHNIIKIIVPKLEFILDKRFSKQKIAQLIISFLLISSSLSFAQHKLLQKVFPRVFLITF